MPLRSVVAGVDDSPEGIRSAKLAWVIASKAGVDCCLVHAAREYWATSGGTDIPIDVGAMNRAVLQIATERLTDALADTIPPETLAGLEVRLGRAAVLIRDIAAERDAGLVVLGAKHHAAVTRWIGGSTVHNVVRTSSVPVLVSCMEGTVIERILVAVDASYAATPTVSEADTYARLFGAKLRILHVIEPLPLIAALPIALDQNAYYRISEEQFKKTASQLIEQTDAEVVVRHGSAEETVATEVEEWKADLLVVGSHGKGWVDRLLVGSTTERILNYLPTSTLVVPVPDPQDSDA
ncbi:MAG: universal stress protein [Gemmatimonadota bacterium]|nr:MAG: universal stress protein [Gemmatimonadota bacterium]